METEKIRTLKVGGQEFKAVEVSFDTISEHWNEYLLSNGISVRVKNVVLKIYMIVNDQGELLYDENGDPRVIVNGNLATVASLSSGD